MAGDLNYALRDGRARRYLTKACEQGHAGSCVDLGWMWDHGEGGERDRDTALDNYRRGCDGGAASGCVMLGLHHRDRTDDRARADRFFARACELGDGIACAAASEGARR
jgi:TPR repeat protein